jgi:hypothetical protein
MNMEKKSGLLNPKSKQTRTMISYKEELMERK